MGRNRFALALAIVLALGVSAKAQIWNLAQHGIFVRIGEQVFDNGGNPWPFLSQINAIAYDQGGEGVAYHVPASSASGCAAVSGVSIRPDYICFKVSIAEVPYQLCCNATGSSYKYTIAVPTGIGPCTVNMRLSNGDSNGGLWNVLIDGVQVAQVSSPFTGDWDTLFATQTSSQFNVSSGNHIIQFVGASASNGDIRWFQGSCQGLSADGDMSVAPFGGPLVTLAGVWSWGATYDGLANFHLLLNGTPVDAGSVIEVSNGGQIYDFFDGDWYDYNGTNFPTISTTRLPRLYFNPSILSSLADTTAGGTAINALSAFNADNTAYVGPYSFVPGFDGGGRFTINGSNILVGSSGTGAGPQTLSLKVQLQGGSAALPLPFLRDASTNWQKAGLQTIGGIPSRATQCGSTVTPIGSGSDDTAAIQAAINACTAGQFVDLGVGTFTIAEGQSLNLNKGITLRGRDHGTTVLRHPPGADATNNVCNAAGAWGATVNSFCPGNNPKAVITIGKGAPSSAGSSALGADAAKGVTTIQVADTSTFAIGGVALVYELGLGSAQPDTSFNCSPTCSSTIWASGGYRYEWNVHNPAVAFWDSSCLDGGTCGGNNFGGTDGINGDECAYSIVCGGVNEELHLITAVGPGPCPGVQCTLTFDSPLMQVYRTANTATAISYAISQFASQAGLEGVSVAYGDNGNIIFQGCIYCWTKNVESYFWLSGGGVAFFQGAFRDQMESTWVHNAAWPAPGGGGYAVNSTYGATEDLLWDSIVLQANKTNVCRASCAGSVAAYNFMDDSYIKGQSWAEIGLNASHLIGPHHMLFEGNRANNGDADFTHGNSTNITYFRNYMTGYRTPFVDIDGRTFDDRNNLPGGNAPIRCFGSHPYSYWFSYIGNVCGISGAMSGWTYKNNLFGGSPGPTVLKLGWNDSSVSGAHQDDVAAIEYPASPAGAGVTAPGCVGGTDPCTTIVDGNYDYLTNTTKWATNDTSHVLATSLFLTAAPAFFTSGTFGGPYTWPPVDPITPTINNIPAFARWNACSLAGTITPACIFP